MEWIKIEPGGEMPKQGDPQNPDWFLFYNDQRKPGEWRQWIVAGGWKDFNDFTTHWMQLPDRPINDGT